MFPRLSLDVLPETSLFRSGEPFYLIAIPFLVNIPITMVMLHLIWRSVGIRIPIRRSLVPSIIAGLSACLIRQLIPVPFHTILNLALLVIFAMVIGRMSVTRALLGGIFAISVTLIGSFLTIEPLLLFVKDFVYSSPGFTLLCLIETIIPLIVLLLFARFNLTLLPRVRNAAKGHAETP